MSIRMITKPIATADNSATIPGVYQNFFVSTTADPKILRGIHAEFHVYNNPTFATITAEIWHTRSSIPSYKIATSSTSWTKAQCIPSQPHAWVKAGFLFSDLPLKPGTVYSIALRMDGTYVGNDSSFVGFRVGYPDPQYRTNVDVNSTNNADNFPYSIAFIGGDR